MDRLAARALALAFPLALACAAPARADELDRAKAACRDELVAAQAVGSDDVYMQGGRTLETTLQVRGSVREPSGERVSFLCVVGRTGEADGKVLDVRYLAARTGRFSDTASYAPNPSPDRQTWAENYGQGYSDGLIGRFDRAKAAAGGYGAGWGAGSSARGHEAGGGAETHY